MVHVQPSHAAKLSLRVIDLGHSLSGEGAEGTVVASGGKDDVTVDGVGVHAQLGVVVERHQRPVGDDTSHSQALFVFSGDQILDGSSIKQLDVRELEHLQHEGQHKEGGVLDDDIIAFVFVFDTELVQEHVGRLSRH